MATKQFTKEQLTCPDCGYVAKAPQGLSAHQRSNGHGPYKNRPKTTRKKTGRVYVRADGPRLAGLVATLAQGQLSLRVAATLPLAEAATALRSAVAGRAAGASVLTLEPA